MGLSPHGVKRCQGAGSVGLPSSNQNAGLDTPRLGRCLDLLEPLGYFSESEFPKLIHDHARTTLLLGTDREEFIESSADIARRFHEPEIKAILGDGG
ncbi:MAG TPA: hypothetical protein VI072_19550 [Polyangiaceae bacterium]